jgi:hypothetical protein
MKIKSERCNRGYKTCVSKMKQLRIILKMQKVVTDM